MTGPEYAIGITPMVALRIAKQAEPGRTMVTLHCDTGIKYLSNPAFQA